MFTDNFNRTNENLDASANWTVVTGTTGAAIISSNQLGVDTAQPSGLIVCPDQGLADHYAEYDLQNVFTHSYVVCRATDGDNFIGLRGWDNKWDLDKYVAGVKTNIGQWATTPVAGDTARIECVGNTITVDVNGVERINITEAFNNTETRQGVVPILSSPDPWIDTFEVGALGVLVPSLTNIDSDDDVFQGQTGVLIQMANVPTTVSTWDADIGGSSLTKISWNTDQTATVDIPVGTTLTAGATLTVNYTE